MFTGIVEEIGRIKAVSRGAKSVTLEVEAQKVMQGTAVGDSIATNGVCLTVTTITPNGYTADVMPETVAKTSLASLRPGSKVNLERALTLQSRLGGHLVSGHVDGTAVVRRLERDDNAIWVWMEAQTPIMRYIIAKGSVTVQGVSLTVARVTKTSFAVSLIPHTQGATTLHELKVGDVVNIENDVVAKYVEKLMTPSEVTTDSTGEEHTTTESTEDKINVYRSFMTGSLR